MSQLFNILFIIHNSKQNQKHSLLVKDKLAFKKNIYIFSYKNKSNKIKSNDIVIVIFFVMAVVRSFI